MADKFTIIPNELFEALANGDLTPSMFIAMQFLHRSKPVTQDGRVLRRYRRRWKIERLFAWLHNYRRIVIRWEYYPENFLGMVQLACTVILLRHL
jgi:IS4 transposase